MQHLALALSIVAALAAGYAAFETHGAAERLDELARAQERSGAELTQLTARVDGLCEGEGSGHLPAGPPDSSGAAEQGGGAATLATRAPASMSERLQALAKKVDDQQATIARLEEQAKERSGLEGQVARHLRGAEFFFSADQAATAMALDGRQKADMQDILDRAKRDLDDVFRLPNDDGELWEEISKPKTAKIGGQDGALSFSMPDIGKMQKFKKSRIPGSNETYEAAEKRIRDEAFGRVRNILNPKQQGQWDGAQKDGLLGSGMHSSGGMISFVSTSVETSESR